MKVKVQKNFHLVRVGRLPTDAGIQLLSALEYQSISHHFFNYMMVEYDPGPGIDISAAG